MKTNTHSDRSTVFAYTVAILKGTSEGIQDIVQMCLHPLEQVIYPMNGLIYDATIIAAKYSSSMDPDLGALHQYLQRNPEMYCEAARRMRFLSEGLSNGVQNFSKSDSVEQTEMLSRGLTTVFVPGYVMKCAARFIQTARANQLKFGSVLKPPIFPVLNKHKTKTNNYYRSVPTLNPSDILATKNEIYSFVLTEGDELLISTRFNMSKNLLESSDIYHHHHDLARLERVYVAGEMYVFDGKFTFNNMSGHYRPIGHKDMPRMVEQAFEKVGIQGSFKFAMVPTVEEKISTKVAQIYEFARELPVQPPGMIDGLSLLPMVLSERPERKTELEFDPFGFSLMTHSMFSQPSAPDFCMRAPSRDVLPPPPVTPINPMPSLSLMNRSPEPSIHYLIQPKEIFGSTAQLERNLLTLSLPQSTNYQTQPGNLDEIQSDLLRLSGFKF